MDEAIIRAILAIARRADTVDTATLQSSFVGVGNIDLRLSSPDHQIIYGRRGTGKTHTLRYVVANPPEKGIPIFIDLRNIGSNGSIYGDASQAFQQRATTLLLDFLGTLQDRLVDFFLKEPAVDLSVAGPLLDRLANSISATKVEGSVAVTQQSAHSKESSSGASLDLARGPQLTLNTGRKSGNSEQTELKYEVAREAHVIFGDINAPLRELSALIGGRKFLLLIDEWSDVPLDLQPFLADLIRKVLLASGMILKIAAIEHRSRFVEFTTGGQYTGVQLGADVMADISLDDFMVFENDEIRAVAFFKNLI